MSYRSLRYFAFGFLTAITITFLPPYQWLTRRSIKPYGKPIILAFGDSITQRGHNGWVGLLADIYTRRADIINRGFSGYNSKWARDIFQDVVIRCNPDLVIIFFGANDAVIPEVAQHVPVDEYERNLDWMVQALRQVDT